MTDFFQDKVALVTGAGSGIGRATALAFAEQGAVAAVADVDEQAGRQTVRLISKSGGRARFFSVDVAREESVAGLMRDLIGSLGRLDFAFNNAGVGGAASTMDCTEAEWDRVVGVNLKGVWLCLKHELGQMVKAGQGAIVNMASAAGLIGTPNRPAYTASKHGVLGLTKVAALEHAQTVIRVNAVCPGVVRTPLIEKMLENPDYRQGMLGRHPMGRLARPEEIAETVVWLCSDKAAFITGIALPVDGGLVAA